MTLRDLLTQAIPGNPMQNIPLGDANDPQFNKFSFNVIGSLGQGMGNGVVDRNKPGSIFAGPYNVSMGGATGPTPKAPPPPMAGMSSQAGPPPRNQFAPIGSFNSFYDQNFPIGVPGFQQGIAPPPSWGGAGPAMRAQEQPYAPGIGSSLMQRMLAWKG